MIATGDTIPVGFQRTEAGVIPDDWDAKPLQGLAAIVHGFGFKSEYFSDAGEYRLATPGHFFEAGGFRELGDKQKFYDGPVPNGYVLDKGDLIVAMTEQADGLLGSAALVPMDGTYLHNQRLGKVKALSPNICVRFLYRVFNSPHYRAKVRETAAGTKVKHTSPAKLLEIPVPLPPTLAEQEAIAEALGDADALIESLEQLVAKKRHLKQAAMQQLLAGKKRLPGFTGEWEVRQLGDCVSLRSGHHVLATYCNTEGIGTPYLTGPSDFPDGVIQHTKFTDNPTTLCAAHDILVTVKGSGAGTLVIADAIYCISRQLMAIRVNEGDFRFIFYSLLQNAAQFKAAAAGLIPGLSRSDVLEQNLPIPTDLNEQTAIAQVLSDMDTEIEAIEAKLAKARQIKQGMMQELLTGRIRLV